MKMKQKNRMFTGWVLGLALLCLALGNERTRGEGLTVFDQGQAKIYLDVDDKQARDLKLTADVADFMRCVALMTGQKLPRIGGAMLFNPAQSQPTRFESRIVKLEDASTSVSSNASFSLITSINPQFVAKSPFAEDGEKVAWNCVWDRRTGALTFDLTVANQAYYGPGYGPFTFATLQAKVADFKQNGSVRMVLEMQGGEAGNLRGGYAINDQAWVYTEWFNPGQAGIDMRNPGKSDKNGSQAWGDDWPQRWANKTAFYVSAYHAKGRAAAVGLKDIRVVRSDQVIFSGQASKEEMEEGKLGPWRLCHAKGEAVVGDDMILLKPALDDWTSVTLQAKSPADVALSLSSSRLIPLRLELKDYPADANPYGVSLRDIRLAQGFTIEVDDQAIVVRACTSVGLRNALYYMLDYWGCRWVMPGKLGECIPKHATLTFPRGVTRFSPRNHIAFDRPSPRLWGNRNMASWSNWLSAQHYWFYALPPKTHFKTHPQWYSLLAGERKPRQLCTSNPQVVAAMIEVAKTYLRKHSTAISFPMDPVDNMDFCQCDACVALDPPGNMTISGQPVVTDRVLTFINAVAEGIREEFPDRYVAFYAYATHIDPPVKVRPANNVIVALCRTKHCLLHLAPTQSCSTSDFGELVRRWRAVTPNLYLYEYDPISWTGGLPSPTYMAMMRSLKKMFNEESVLGSYSDGRNANKGASTYINRYLALRMKIDPSRNPEEVLRDMCQAFFGPAAETMEQYYRELATVTAFTHPERQKVGFGLTYYHEMFNPRMVRAARGFLDQAIKASSEKSPYRDRLKMVDMSQRYLEAYLDGIWRSQDHQYQAAVEAFDRMDKVITEMEEAKFLAAAGDARQRAKTMRLKALAAYFPQELGFFVDWKLLGPFDNSNRNAARVREVFEPIKSIDKPVVLKDGTKAAWWDYKSPSGFLNLGKALAGRKSTTAVSYVFAGTTFYAQRKMRVQLRMDSYYPFVVYVNGTQVYSRLGNDADCPDKRQVEVPMHSGQNTIVFKLSQTNLNVDFSPWGLYARVIADGPDTLAPPQKWSFKTDPENIGTKKAWYASALDDSQWQRITVPQAWEKSIGAYDGYAWYRTRIKVPQRFKGRAITIQFAGVDEQAWVYVNGSYLGERTTGSTKKTIGEIWNQPFKLTIPSDRVQYGDTNLLVVRVHDSTYAGGIYLPVRLHPAQ